MKRLSRHLIIALLLFSTRAQALELTIYSTIHESDFGKVPTEWGEWRTFEEVEHNLPPHRSLFAPGFLGRESSNPTNDRLSGVGMEGSGFMDPALHATDPELNAKILEGYTVINLWRWDESTHTAKFALSKWPLNSGGGPLLDGVSAAVKQGNKLYPRGRWVRIDVDGKFFQFRKIDDDCSSCVEDQIDLYYDNAATAPDIDSGTPATATVMPEGFVPPPVPPTPSTPPSDKY